ncbi:MAG: YqiA/YcfP family alpha/beta fold hydrolase [Anaerovoracaceae bacterium]|jgi:predicted esterase YcpF (UPF0227 family)
MSRRKKRRKPVKKERKKTIGYVHGLGSTANSRTVQLLRKYLPEYDVISDDVDIRPQYAAWDGGCFGSFDLMIGSSLGGFYAQEGIAKYWILINPALDPVPILREKVGCGTYEYFDERKDGIRTYTLDEKWFEELEKVHGDIENHFAMFPAYQEEMYDRTYIFLGRNDPLIEYEEIEPELKKHYNMDHIQFVEMEHRVTEEFVRDILVPFIKKLPL